MTTRRKSILPDGRRVCLRRAKWTETGHHFINGLVRQHCHALMLANRPRYVELSIVFD